MSDKQLTLKLISEMDDSIKFEDILYNIYLQYKISRGLSDVENGDTKTTSEVKEIIDKW